MDFHLRNLKRQAEATNDVQAWQQYSSALERVLGLAPPKLFAVLSDGTTYGDSLWTARSYIPYEEGDDKRSLMRKHLAEAFVSPCATCIDYALNPGICWYQCNLPECDLCKKFAEFLKTPHRQECDADIEMYAGCVPSEAWIIDEGMAASLDIMDHDCNTDSAWYSLNSAMKCVAQENAIKTLVFTPESDIPTIKECNKQNTNAPA